MVRFFLIFSIFIFKICHAENTVPTFAERLAEWKSRANAHEDNVAYLLSQPPLQKSNFDIQSQVKFSNKHTAMIS